MTYRVPWTGVYPDDPATAAALQGYSEPIDQGPFPDLPDGALPFDRDITITTATTTLLFDPGPGQRVYLVSAFVSTDTAMRVAIVDEADIVNQRPVDGYFAANGGASPNLVPKWYEAKLAGNRLRVVTAAAGNVKVRVSGFTLAG